MALQNALGALALDTTSQAVRDRLPAALNGDGGFLTHVTNTIDIADRSGRIVGHVTVDNSSLAVTGPLTDTQLRATAVPVSLAAAPTTPVTGTFWQATQPVSLATNTPDVTDRSARLLGHVTVDSAPTTAVTQGAAGAAAWKVDGSAVTQPVSGTVSVAQAARTYVVLSAAGVTSIVSETLLSLSQNKAGTVTSGTTYTVTAGKTFRLQAVQFGVRFTTMSTTVTFGTATFRLRTGSLTGPLVLQDSKAAASNVPTPNSDLTIPDGLEFPAGTVLCVSQAASATTLSVDCLLVGYEY